MLATGSMGQQFNEPEARYHRGCGRKWGRKTFCIKLREALGDDICELISQDNYYIDQSDQFTEDGGDVNFDDPSALEFSL